MRLHLGLLLGALIAPLTVAQSSTASTSTNVSASATPSNSTRSSNDTQQIITTTITSLISGPSGSASSTSLLTLTLTLNSSYPTNTTVNGTSTVDNSTTTNATGPWKEGDDWIPFHIRIDPAYGVLGGILILSGIPVAGLGGKNRWSSLAIVSGYALMLFTLVMVLRFGVQENLQPPSPNPPSTTLRGLYLLACLVASFIGAGIGIFFFNIAKYFVSAAGGFAFGWFLLETKSGGLITSVLGRWGLLGGLTVGALLASIVPKMVDHMTLASTAWIGATAFMLGVDCFTRAGLKEFYIYNLGFHSLFPKLDGAKYPLTQTMIIELGILAAVVLIGAAIQARVLNRIQKRLREAREEEEMRLEAEEVSRAAENFKNIGTDLAEWEEKHGKGAGNVSGLPGSSSSFHDGSTSQLPILQHGQASGSHLPPIGTEARGLYSELPLHSPPVGREFGTPTTAHFDVEELKDNSTPRTLAARPAMTDSELEDKLKLLEEVKKARESIRGSIDELRKQTPTPSLGGRLDPGSSSRPITPAYSLNGRNDGRPVSVASRLDDFDPRGRKMSKSSSHILDPPDKARYRPPSTTSTRLLDITHDTPQTDLDDVGPMRTRQHSSTSSRLLDVTHSRRVSDGSRNIASPQASPTEWDQYVSDRKIIAPSQHANPYGRAGADMANRRDKTTSMIDLSAPPISRSASHDDRRSRTLSMLDPGVPSCSGQYHTMSSSRSRDPSLNEPYAPGLITGSASSRGGAQNQQRTSVQHRSMTYEELSDRHRKRISALQNPVSSAMKEEEELRLARERWERQKKEERAQMQRKQQQGASGVRDVERDRARGEEKQEILKATDEWRRSVHGGLDGFGRRVSTQGLEGVRGTASGGGTGRSRDKRLSHIVN